MSRLRFGIILSFAAAVLLGSSTARAAEPGGVAVRTDGTTGRPDTYGIADYNVVSISDLSFTPQDSALAYATGDDLFRYATGTGGGTLLAGATIPKALGLRFPGNPTH